MAQPPKHRKIYWDSCAWIAQISSERRTLADGSIENRGALCRAVIDSAEKGATEVFTSALALAEVSKQAPGTPTGTDKVKEFFQNDYIIVVQLDRKTGELARDFMQQGWAGLKPPDAVHLASAVRANVDEMHTFDQKLLNLDGKFVKSDGTLLKICKPSLGGPPLPLLETPTQNDETVGEQVGSIATPPEAEPLIVTVDDTNEAPNGGLQEQEQLTDVLEADIRNTAPAESVSSPPENADPLPEEEPSNASPQTPSP